MYAKIAKPMVNRRLIYWTTASFPGVVLLLPDVCVIVIVGVIVIVAVIVGVAVIVAVIVGGIVVVIVGVIVDEDEPTKYNCTYNLHSIGKF